MYMIMLVLDDPNLLDDVLQAWRSTGISGATILESMGAYRRETEHLRGRFLFGMPGLVETTERSQYTLFAIVGDEEIVRLCLKATEEVVGDLSDPDTGVFTAWEVALAKGVPEQSGDAEAKR